MSKEWFDKYWGIRETPEFTDWWLEHYGPPGAYDGTISEQDEYWVRRAFALMGWLAGRNER